MFDRILSCTNSHSDQLQSGNVDLAKAADLVLATQSTLEEYSTETWWEKIYEYAERIGQVHGIEISPLTQTRQRQLPRRLEDGIIMETIGMRDSCRENYNQSLMLF